jgi:hypothetical protein
VLADFVKFYPDLKITVLVQNPLHIKVVHDLGVQVVQGSFSNTDLISSQACAADITVNLADYDNTAVNEAILAGQRARMVEDGKPPPVLFHTSGVAVFSDGGKEGKHDTNNKVYNVHLLHFKSLFADLRVHPCLAFYRIALRRTSVLLLLRCCMVKSTYHRLLSAEGLPLGDANGGGMLAALKSADPASGDFGSDHLGPRKASKSGNEPHCPPQEKPVCPRISQRWPTTEEQACTLCSIVG